jgi:hypothetical protein
MGEEVLENGLVSNIKGKKIENIYHIYGDILNHIDEVEFKTHIKINLLSKKVEGVRCTCDNFKEFLEIRAYSCVSI